jgi:hypothetical protein
MKANIDKTIIEIDKNIKIAIVNGACGCSLSSYRIGETSSIEIIRFPNCDSMLIGKNDKWFLYSNHLGNNTLYNVLMSEMPHLCIRGGSRHTLGYFANTEYYNKKENKIDKGVKFIPLSLATFQCQHSLLNECVRTYTIEKNAIEKLELHHRIYVWDNRSNSTMIVSHSKHKKLDSHSKKFGFEIQSITDLKQFILKIRNDELRNNLGKRQEMATIGVKIA